MKSDTAIQINAIEELVKTLRQQGWTKKDFARALKEFLEEEDKRIITDKITAEQ
jgi:hypothetical protein